MIELVKKYKNVLYAVGFFVITLFSVNRCVDQKYSENTANFNEKFQDSIRLYKDSISLIREENSLLKHDKNQLLLESKSLGQKETIIKERYVEKIKYVDRYSIHDLQLYFDKRYGTDSSRIK